MGRCMSEGFCWERDDLLRWNWCSSCDFERYNHQRHEMPHMTFWSSKSQYCALFWEGLIPLVSQRCLYSQTDRKQPQKSVILGEPFGARGFWAYLPKFRELKMHQSKPTKTGSSYWLGVPQRRTFRKLVPFIEKRCFHWLMAPIRQASKRPKSYLTAWRSQHEQ